MLMDAENYDKPVMARLHPVCLAFSSVAVIIVFYSTGSEGSSFEISRLMRPAYCPGRVIALAHRYRTCATRSVLECASLCQQDDHCESVVFDVSNKMCHFGDSTADGACTNTISADRTWKYYEKRVTCKNGGVFNPNSANCTCPDGYHGDSCDVTGADCEEYLEKGWLTEKGIFYVKPRLYPTPFPVYCDYLPPSNLMRTRILNREEESFSFNLTWQEYRDGFGEPDAASFWLGLEKLHHLTTDRSFEARFRVDLTDTNFYQWYEKFVISDEASGYSVSFNQTTRNLSLGDCLSDLYGAKFSTYDMDNDDSASVHCALQHGGGWWFKGDSCSSCNPLGSIISPFDGQRKGIKGESFWTIQLGDLIPFPLRVYLVPMP